MDKAEIINHVIELEGGYVNDACDSGGETNFGITVAVARECGYSGEMCDMPHEVAFSIYSARYWDAVKADELLTMSEPLACEIVDTSINMGPGRAGKFLQRALNVLNGRESLYPDVTVDGMIGPGTLKALAEYLDARDDSVLLTALKCLQGAFYIELCERREKDEAFVYGWLKNRV